MRKATLPGLTPATGGRAASFSRKSAASDGGPRRAHSRRGDRDPRLRDGGLHGPTATRAEFEALLGTQSLDQRHWSGPRPGRHARGFQNAAARSPVASRGPAAPMAVQAEAEKGATELRRPSPGALI